MGLFRNKVPAYIEVTVYSKTYDLNPVDNSPGPTAFYHGEGREGVAFDFKARYDLAEVGDTLAIRIEKIG